MAAHHKNEFLKCLSEFFKRDLLSIPIVKKYPHASVGHRCGLKATTLELDTAAYPNVEYIAGTRLSVYPMNQASHVQAIMEHLVDDLAQHPVMVDQWSKFAKLNGTESLRLALTYLFDITTAPSRELIKLLADKCHEKEQRKRLVVISQTNESWERWICSGHRTLKALFEEHNSCKVPASILLNELHIQQPRQYSISNIKSSKRFRAEIIVVQHRFSLRQIELNLRQLRDRETYERTISPATSPPAPPLPLPTVQPSASPARPASKSNSRSAGQPQQAQAQAQQRPTSSPVADVKSTSSLPRPVPRRPAIVGPSASPPAHPTAPAGGTSRSPSRPAQSMAAARPDSSKGSRASNRSVRSMASFASSPITTHRVRRVSSFSGPLMSAYANASSASATSSMSAISGSGSVLEKSRTGRKSMLSVLESQNKTINSESGALASTSPVAATKYEGLCSNYLLNTNANEHLICEFVENPRFTLKGNRERPIMLIGQDLGMIAFRAFWQQRHLEHDRAQVFYKLFTDLSPKKFGEMQLVCLTGHKCRIEELFKREIQAALASRILSSYTCVNRKHLLGVLVAATSKSQLVLSQMQEQQPNNNNGTLVKSTLQPQQQAQNLPINSKELLELGDRIYKLLVENNGCLYTCCDPHMTQAIEILTFESIARNNSQLTREKLMKLLPMWKGRSQADTNPAFEYSLENIYERAAIVQEIYDSSI